MSAMTKAQRDALAKRIFSGLCRNSVEHYDKGSEGQWVTIGGGPGAKGERHAGGTPVKIAPGGQISAGPDKLEGKHIDHVDRDKGDRRPPKTPGGFDAQGKPIGTDAPAWHGLREQGDAAHAAGNFDKAARRWKEAAAMHPGGQAHPEAAELLKRAASPEGAPTASAPPTKEELVNALTERLYGQAVATVKKSGRGQEVLLQRQLGVGYERAVSLLDRMTKEGILGPAKGIEGRELIGTAPARAGDSPIVAFLKRSMSPQGHFIDEDGNQTGGDWFNKHVDRMTLDEQREAIRWLRQHGTPAQQRWQLGAFPYDVRRATGHTPADDRPVTQQDATTANQIPGQPRAGGPAVDADKHAQVKAAAGGQALVAYEHEGAYYFLHDDASPASQVLDGATAVTKDGLNDALGKLVKAGHRVAIAEPEGKKKLAGPKPGKPADTPPASADPASKQPGQAAEKPASDVPAPSLFDSPTSANPPKAKPDKAAAPPTESPDKPADGPAEGTTKDSGQPPPAQAEGSPATSEAKKRGFELPPPPGPKKGRQLSLFDRLKQPDSPEAKEMPTAAAIARGQGPHRLANQHGEQPPPGVSVDENGIWSGVATLHMDDIHVDPARFQYKISGIGKGGVTKQLADVKKFNPMFAGQILVWRDPADGKTYVVNGHHRVELAKRSGPYDDPATGLKWQGELQSYYIPAKTHEQARAIGALANMAAGHGTATDAAKFMRDTGRSIDDLKAQGISLKGKLAADAVQLKDLSSRAFDDLTRGLLAESRAIAVATHLKNPEHQDKLFRKLADRERTGRPVSDEAAAEAAKEMELAGSTKAQGGGLFGDFDDEHSLEIERGEVKAAIRKALTSERNTFQAVATKRRVGKIQAEGKNVLDVEGNKQRAQRADETLGMFDKLANSKGELSSAIQSAAEKFYHAPATRDQTIRELIDQLPSIIDRQWQQFGGRPGSSEQPEPEQHAAERYSAAAGNVGRGVCGSLPGREGPAGSRHAGAGNSGAGSLRCEEVFRQRVRRNLDRAKLAAAIRPAIERYAVAWVEAKHPRGQPENAGEFRAKGTPRLGSPSPGTIGGSAAPSSIDYRPTGSPAPSLARQLDPKELLGKLGEGKPVRQAVDEMAVHNTPAVKAVEQQFPPANPAGYFTLDRHRQADGTMTPQRQALHEAIIATMRRDVPTSSDKTYYMMGGGPASGKSSILNTGLVKIPTSVNVDVDAIKGYLPEYNSLVAQKDLRAGAYVHDESSVVGQQVIDQSIAAGQNVLHDGTGNSSYESLSAKVAKARAAGYKVHAAYVTCAVEEAVRRNIERAKVTGRLPPEAMLRDVHKSVSDVVPRAAADGLFDTLKLWDTEHKDANGHPVLVMSAAAGQVTVHHPELWESFKAKGSSYVPAK